MVALMRISRIRSRRRILEGAAPFSSVATWLAGTSARPPCAGQVEPQQVDGAGALGGLHAQAHVVAVAVGVFELRNHFAGHQAAHGGGHGAEVQAQVAGGLAVHRHAHLGLRLFLAGVHVGGAGHLAHLAA